MPSTKDKDLEQLAIEIPLQVTGSGSGTAASPFSPSPLSATSSIARHNEIQHADGYTSVANVARGVVVDWDGPKDPQNPLNWAPMKKRLTFGIIAMITFISPLASSMFAPGVKLLMEEFKTVDQELASFSVSSYVLGFALGPLIMAPLSELYGRSPVYIVGNIVFLAFTIACAVAPTLASFIVFRIFAGIAGSVPLTLGGGSIADVYVQEERGMAMAMFALGPLLGPVIGPIAGGFLAQAKGWRWVFWLLSIMLGFTAILAALFLKETYAPVLLKRKAKRLALERGDPTIHSQYGTGDSPRKVFTVAITRPLAMLVLDPIILILALYLAVIFGYMYLMFTTFPMIFATKYGFSTGVTGLAYIGLGVGCFLGVLTIGMMSDPLLVRLKKKHGVSKPEFRLPPMIFFSWALPGSLFWYGWTADKAVHWIVPIIATGFFGLGFFAAMMCIQTYLVDAYGLYAASALAANTVVRSLVGAFLPFAGQPMYETLGIGWGTSLLAFIALVFMPCPILFYLYGERIRRRFARTY